MVQRSQSQSTAIEEALKHNDPAILKTIRDAHFEELKRHRYDLQNALVLQEEDEKLYDMAKIDLEQVAFICSEAEKSYNNV